MIPVMLIEDEFLVRIGIKTCIPWERVGYEVVAEADSGEEAVELYERHLPKLVITDIRLPHKSGIEVMKEIREKDRAVKFIIVSAYDDFEIAREAIGIGVEGYFVKGSLNPEELTTLLSKLRETLDDNSTFLTEEKKSRESLSCIYRKIQFSDTRLYEAEWAERQREEVHFWILKLDNTNLEAFAQMISDFLERKKISCKMGVEERYVWVLSASGTEQLCELQNEMQGMFRRYVHCKVAVGISRAFSENNGLEEIIYEAVMAVHVCKVLGGIPYVVYEETDDQKPEYNRNLQKIEELLRLNKIEPALQKLEEIYGLFGNYCPVKSYKRFLYKLAGILNDYDTGNYKSGYYEELLQILDVEGAFHSLRQRMEMIGLNNAAKAEGNDYAAKAVEYIYDHYQERISTTKIAEYIHVSSNYLGKIFYSATGEHLTDFINRVRIEKAKVLLAESKMSIGEIADLVGIGDQRYFAKLFKKCCGATPKEYRGLKENQ